MTEGCFEDHAVLIYPDGRRVTGLRAPCEIARDDNPESIAHHAHEWDGRLCPGWFPLVSCKRDGIRYGTT